MCVEVFFEFHNRFLLLIQVAPNIPLNISTMVLARVTKLPYIGTPHKRSVESKEVKIVAVPMPEPKPDIVPLWIIILSAIVGVIILLLLIYLLYKVKYNSNRPFSPNVKFLNVIFCFLL